MTLNVLLLYSRFVVPLYLPYPRGNVHLPLLRRCVLFSVIAAAPSMVVERRIAFRDMLNGTYTDYAFCLGEIDCRSSDAIQHSNSVSLFCEP